MILVYMLTTWFIVHRRVGPTLIYAPTLCSSFLIVGVLKSGGKRSVGERV